MTAKPSIRFFNDSEIRAVWDKAEGEWRFAAVDVIAAVTGSSNPRNYWSVLKNRLKKSGFEPLTRCKGFKLTAADGRSIADHINGNVFNTLFPDHRYRPALT